jgi:hypothetical protein
MAFLNRYNSSDLQIKSAKEFSENNQLFNYAVGKSSQYPTILKSKTDGTVVWKKDYKHEQWGIDMVFHEIIPITNNAQVIEYVIYASNNQNHYILKINAAGVLLFLKKIKLFVPLGVFLVESKINNNFYLVFTGRYEGSEPTYGGNSLSQLMALEFDTQINIVNKNYYNTSSASDMILNSVKSYEDGILVLFDHKAGKTHLVDLNYDLSVKIAKEIHIGTNSYSDFYSDDAVIVSSNLYDSTLNQYIVSGKNGQGQVLLLSLDVNNQNYNNIIPQSTGCESNMIIVNNELYLNIYQSPTDKQGSVVHKIKIDDLSSLDILWSKTFQIDRIYHGIKRLIKSTVNNIFIYPSADESLLFDSDLNLSTCKTITLNYSLPVSSSFKLINRTLRANRISYDVQALDNFFVLDNTIDPVQLCDATPDPNEVEEPCIKDENICTEYIKLLELFTKCIEEVKRKNPDYIRNLAVFKDCFKKFLEYFLQIAKNLPQLNLEQNLQFQINTIKAYLNYNDTKELEKYYNEATSAVQFILQYLSQLGNCNCENNLNLTDHAMIQSGHLYLQSAGSVGEDSAKGIHLRWALKDALSEHLPKANYADNTHNFNKSDDFVKIYRAKYVPYKVILDFEALAPIQINDGGSSIYWIYEIGGKIFHVHFRNNIKYNQVLSSVIPSDNPLLFIKNYGDALLEVETKTELSFKISANFAILNNGNFIKTELLSVPENKITAPKGASLRKTYTAQELNQKPLVSENIRSIRFSGSDAHVLSLSFEFYSDFIINTKKENKWNFLGKYALTKETDVAFKRLEPQNNCLSNWLRYNDQAYVNVENYQNKWNSNSIPELERIYTSVEKYITLSNALDNPKAIELYAYQNQDDVEACNLTDPNYDPNNPEYDPYIPETFNENNAIKIPYLDVLLLGSMDYHVARMLGLGTLDLNPLVFEGEYMYLAEYVTFGNLQDGLGSREVQHLYCSLPTSLSDQRLPIPVDLKEPLVGVFFNTGYDDSDVDEEDESEDPEQNNVEGVQITVDGYSADRKTKYYTLYAESFFDEQSNAPFYYVDNEFIACETTDPVFAGLEYRKLNTSEWIKPEPSHSTEFYNIDTSGIPLEFSNETVELVIPDEGKALYTIAIRETSQLEYSSYGINWFSRATLSEVVKPVITIIEPTNELLPPTNVTATLIQKESPMVLTTPAEQSLFTANANANSDKTLVRLTFDYNHTQELIDYHHKINGEVIPNYFETANERELFADEIQVFFRNQVPNSISGKIKQIVPSSNPLLIEVLTEPYPVQSSGVDESVIPQTNPPTYNETFVPFIIQGTEINYIGSIFLVNGKEFIVQEIDNTGMYPKFIVLKADASGSLLNLNSLSNPEAEILVPEIGALFMIVENMQNLPLWGMPDNSGFSIKIAHTNIQIEGEIVPAEVHREEEIIIKNIDCSRETHVQKFRGIYQNGVIEKYLEKVDLDGDGDYDESGGQFIYKHLGLYKITFPGYQLPQHLQYNLITNPFTNSVEWYNGVVRLHCLNEVGNEPRKDFKVIRTENIGTSNDLVLHIQDLNFPTDLTDPNYQSVLAAYDSKLIPEGDNSINQMVNYYPGYKVYLYKDTNLGLDEDNVLPQGDDEVRFTVFGLRSRDYQNEFPNDNPDDFFSNMSVPEFMFANAIIEAIQPQKPSGGFYATRPDYFGKSSYTFNTKYGTPQQIHKPYSVQFNRASDIQFLNAIYDNTVQDYVGNQEPPLNTVQEVMRNIFKNGEEDFYVDRWNNLLSFDYDYTGELPNDPAFTDDNGFFKYFEGIRLPMPNNTKFIESINLFIDQHNEFYNNLPIAVQHISVPILNLNQTVIHEVILPGNVIRNTELTIKDFLKDVLLGCFVPLTEVPIIYNYVKPHPYKPIPKKQVVRDRNGYLLKPTLEADSDFDMAPMMKRIDPPNSQFESQFTDFGIDGASNAKYFYAVREINNQLKTSDYSEILGPISLVNTAPPVTPEIIKVIPVLENRTLGNVPSVQLQINAYPKAQNIAKISIYRTDNSSDALSIRTMKLVKRLDLEVENLMDESTWIFEDDFSDLVEVPFGDPLFYRLTVSRRIRYNDKELQNIVDYTPSEASKLIITNIVENYSPQAPKLNCFSEPLNSNNELTTVILHWEKMCYKAKYHLYKMNSQGNWVKIHELHTNDQDIYLPLQFTDLASGTLSVIDSQDNKIYHHFKVITENTAGMTSSQERILTVYNESDWQDIGGIGDMIIEGTFYVR